jgi:hypothetical protein
MAGRPDPKPSSQRVEATVEEWQRLRELKLHGQKCRLCDRPAESLHHVIPRRRPYLGDDLGENLVGLCGDGVTSGCHLLIEQFQSFAIRARLRASLAPEEFEYAFGKVGLDRLDGLYPALPALTEEGERAELPDGRQAVVDAVGPATPSSVSVCPHPELQPGERCGCGFRKPFPRKTSSPRSTTKAYRVPADERQAHDEVLAAAVAYTGLDGRPFADFYTVTYALAALLRDGDAKDIGKRQAA